MKVPIALEELGLEYALEPVNIRAGEQRAEGFLALNANGKVPVLVDDDGPDGRLVLSESVAILIYVAEKTGRLLPSRGTARSRVFEQLLWHASGFGPAFGNAGYFLRLAPEPVPQALARFSQEAQRLVALLDRILERRAFVAGDDVSIADIAHFGWFWRHDFAGVSLADAANVRRWYDALAARPAFQRGIARLGALAPA